MSKEVNSSFEVGNVLNGTVTKVEENQVLVNVGFKTDGIIPLKELSNFPVEKASDVVSLNEELQVKIVKHKDEDLFLSLKAVKTAYAWNDLIRKFEQNEIFDVTVKEVVSAGLIVDVGVRGFIPASHVENFFVDDLSSYVNQTLSVLIVELDKDKNRVILSHKAVVELQERDRKKKVFNAIKVGETVEGTVQRIANFGVFIDLGGVDGLVHISQLSHQRVEHPSAVVSEGEKVLVKVLDIDLDNERISLSIKDTLPGPWDEAKGQIQSGAVLEGKVTRLANFGAFVQLLPGVEGLIHISQLSTDRVSKPNDVVEVGQTVNVKVLDANFNEKRISLSIRAIEESKEREEMEKYVKEYKQEEQGFSLADRLGEKLKKYKKD